MRLWLALLALVPACGFHSAAAPDGGDGGGGDDDGSNTPDASFCYGSIVRVCLFAPPTTPVMLTDNTDIDTGTASPSAMCHQNNDKMADYCVVAGTTFSLAATKMLTAHGSRPLVILATETADVSGTVDVSSHRTGTETSGAGAATAAACPGITVPVGSSGGAGGSFGGKGGDGADGNPDDGSKGIAAPAVTPFPALRGGCPGGDGNGSGKGGSGGGAVAIIATQIQLNGRINASGEAGQGGGIVKSGGGGGGAGGMVVLDATSIMLGTKPTIFANGGGGGQGGAMNAAGVDGTESSAPSLNGGGGHSPALGGDGGDSTRGTTLDAPNAPTDAAAGGGGGGGGGGAGIIHAPGLTGDLAISPPSTNP